MAKVLVANNYSLAGVWQEVNIGQTPDQYLYGINYFHERNYEVELIEGQGDDQFLRHLQKTYERLRVPIPVGSLEQQSKVLSRCVGADLIYSPCQTQTQLLSYMRELGILKVPLVCIAHQPLNPGRLSWCRAPFVRLVLTGADAFPSLSSKIANDIERQGGKTRTLTWGPDKDFYQVGTTPGTTIVAAGRTGRDFITFARACARASADAHIICLDSAYQEELEQSAGVNVTVRPDSSFLPFPELIKIYAEARALAIPLYSANHLNGLSSLVDALAMAKPVIMTKNPYIDVDIEALGIGLWVEPNDEEGWVRAVRFFQDNPDRAIEMGRRGRQLVDAGLNSRTFANQVMDIFDQVLTK